MGGEQMKTDKTAEQKPKNPYDCSACDSEDCPGCGESAWENGYEVGKADLTQQIRQECYNEIKQFDKRHTISFLLEQLKQKWGVK